MLCFAVRRVCQSNDRGRLAVVTVVMIQMLMGIVDASVKLLNNLQDLVPVLIELGLRHNAYKVTAHVPLYVTNGWCTSVRGKTCPECVFRETGGGSGALMAT